MCVLIPFVLFEQTYLCRKKLTNNFAGIVFDQLCEDFETKSASDSKTLQSKV